MSEKQMLRALGVLVLLAICISIGSTPALAVTGSPHALAQPNAPAIAGDEKWMPTFSGATPNGPVIAIAVRGSDVYVGGNFTDVGGVTGTAGIAKWNGKTKSWSALDDGVQGAVYALVFKGSDLYVGGSFAYAGNNTPDTLNIAKWSTATETWSALGTGITGGVNALAVMGTDLYAGGTFTNAGGVADTAFIAKWSTKPGGTWSALAGGPLNNTVYTLAVKGKDLYVGGAFTAVNPATAPNLIGRWNAKAQKWYPLMEGASGNAVYALDFKGTDLYIGGDFFVNYSPIVNLGKWSVSKKAWGLAGAGMTDKPIRALVVKGTNVYVGGEFTAAAPAASGAVTNRIARWSTTKDLYYGLGSGVDGGGGAADVFALAVKGNHLYVGGVFQNAGGVTMPNLADYVMP